MNEIRKDYLLDRWVILSPKRSKRPKQVVEEKQVYRLNCPFCPKNEYMTPPAFFEEPAGDWKIRVIENKFPALVDTVKFKESREEMKIKFSGFGRHEVVIDTPKHNLHMMDFPMTQMELWFDTIKKRVLEHRKTERIKFSSIFKNHGAESGASIEHQHTQIIAVPFRPVMLDLEMRAAKDYYNFQGRCIFCDLAEMEGKSERVVINNEHLTAFCSYAPLWPYEVWIVPKKHVSSIDMPENLEEEILKAIKAILKAYYNILSDPPFNFFFHYVFDPETDKEGSKYYHFHIEMAPRIEKDGGFEYASGMNITTAVPEEAARELRDEIKRLKIV